MPIINIRHRGRNDTEANWQQANPILLKGEPAYSTDKNNRYKIGDGTSHWDELEYAGYKIGDNITETNNTLSITSENIQGALGFNPATRNAATIMAAGLMSQMDKAKLNTIEEGANNYIHPNYLERTEGFYKVTVDDEGHVINATNVVKSDITGLGIPAQDTTYTVATTSKDGLMSSEDKTKLDGIASGANKYTHPSFTQRAAGLYKITVNNQGHVSDATAVAKSDITALGIPAQDTTYDAATTSEDGLMSSEDKTKLDGIATGANKYTHPSYTQRSSGLYKITVDGSGHVSGATAVTKSDITELGIPAQDTNTTYTVATTSKDGLMSSEDKTKLDGIASGANKTVVDSSLSSSSTNPVQNKVINSALAGKVPTSRTVNGKALSSNIVLSASDVNAIPSSQKGTAGGVATLDSSGFILSSQLPPSVDEILEGYLYNNAFYEDEEHDVEIEAQSSKIYVDLNNNLTYRWSGTAYVEISKSLAIGETSSTAFRGDRGKIAYNHSQAAHARTDATNVADSSTNGNILVNGSQVNVYTHPSYTQRSSGLYKITVDGSGHVSGATAVTKSDITALGIPAQDTNTTYTVATTSKDGLMSSEDKTKLDGIASGANKYTHPSYTQKSSGLYKITVDGSGHVSGATAVTKSDITGLGIPSQDTNTWIALKGATSSADGTAGYAPAPTAGASNRYLRSDGTWAVPPDTNTTYSVATTSTNGLMSAADKVKLNGIATNANNYTHPTFTARSAGLYKITVNNNGHVSAATAVAKSDITALGIPAQDTTYSAATTSKAGLMSAADKVKLNGIHAGANNIEYSTTQPTGQAVGDYWVKLE